MRKLTEFENSLINFCLIFLFHGVFLLSVFDIFFKSNIHTNLEPVHTPSSLLNDSSINYKEAKRLVLFVSDGLPAEYLYNLNGDTTNSPFVRSIVTNRGSWGLSYTRVPTESRPGHIALIAGLYEDPSALFKGWKENPVTFDSVFNQSSLTIGFGCHDILHLFQKGSSTEHIVMHSFPPELQEYSGVKGGAAKMDDWVLKEFSSFLYKQTLNNQSFQNLLNRSRLIFFFHLLGTDVAGHAHKPHTQEYFNTILNADRIVEQITKLIEKVFDDNSTAFIFTSDHGMTDWGSHGAGSEIETVTPIVAWGSGINPPTIASIASQVSTIHGKGSLSLNGKMIETPSNWKLQHLRRHDINQADIAVMMATLIKVPIPVNSVGILPIDMLSWSPAQKCLPFFNNAKQLMNQFKAKESDTMSQLPSFLFSAYTRLSDDKKLSYERSILKAIELKQYDKAIADTRKFIGIILEGIKYYDSYFQNVLLLHIVIQFLALSLVIVGHIIKQWNPLELQKCSLKRTPPKYVYAVTATKVLIVLFSLVLLILGVSIPNHYLLYLISTLFLTTWAFWANPWLLSLLILFKDKEFVAKFFAYICGLHVLIFSFTFRGSISVVTLILSLWPVCNENLRAALPNYKKILWISSSCTLSFFPFLSLVENDECILLKIVAGLIWACFLILPVQMAPFRYFGLRNSVTKIQTILLPLCLYNMFKISCSFSNGEGLYSFNQFISFFVLIILLVCTKFGSNRVYPKFINLSFSVGVTFLLFTLSYEAFFPLVLCLNLLLWIDLEETLNEQLMADANYRQERSNGFISSEDVRRSFFYIYLIFISFFGVGNVASLNSFNVAWIRGFITSFSPFVMMFLIILRTILPLFLVTCSFRFVILQTRANSKALFYIVLLFCDFMAVQFLYKVTNVGSWLEIGMSLTHFIIMECIVLFLLLMYHFVKMITSSVDVSIAHMLPKWDSGFTEHQD